jgi:hypothetical protein
VTARERRTASLARQLHQAKREGWLLLGFAIMLGLIIGYDVVWFAISRDWWSLVFAAVTGACLALTLIRFLPNNDRRVASLQLTLDKWQEIGR